MLRAYRIINSKDKKNIRFVAAGSYQIEFFGLDDRQYFAIYRFQSDGSSAVLVELENSRIASAGLNGFQILVGVSTFKIIVTIKNNKSKVYVTRYLWGWLPVSRMGGNISNAGISSLKANFESYAKDLEA
ncbi:MAG: hypothetical protein COB04_19175 [Gammaproteobacteria bacterium]|nr:MAG: hypothetical protein COB04_19175 [Gammaproteobacteria bacterium]